jgi:hypothetical protein
MKEEKMNGKCFKKEHGKGIPIQSEGLGNT